MTSLNPQENRKSRPLKILSKLPTNPPQILPELTLLFFLSLIFIQMKISALLCKHKNKEKTIRNCTYFYVYVSDAMFLLLLLMILSVVRNPPFWAKHISPSSHSYATRKAT